MIKCLSVISNDNRKKINDKLNMKPISLVVIDPQVGFCHPQGSLGLAYGEEELKSIIRMLPSLAKAMAQSERVYIVQSEYAYGQFSKSPDDALAKLCVPGKNNDCQLIEQLAAEGCDGLYVKGQPSAASNSVLLEHLKMDMAQGAWSIVLVGFLLEHCVKASAIDLRRALPAANITVCTDLCGSRQQKYANGEVDAALTLLQEEGILCQRWQDIGSYTCLQGD